MTYTDETIMPRGKYKFCRLKDIPASYFITIWRDQKGGGDPLLKEYLQKNIDRIIAIGVPITEKIVPFICDKKTFATEKDARRSLKTIREAGGNHNKPMRVYECPKCSGWHLTSMDIEVFKNKN